jgi:hypothetical protein
MISTQLTGTVQLPFYNLPVVVDAVRAVSSEGGGQKIHLRSNRLKHKYFVLN